MVRTKEILNADNFTPRFPMALVAAAVVTMLGLMIWSRCAEYNTGINHRAELSRASRLSYASARILHLDEVLTMSARMAAATGDKKWIARYNRFDPELDRLIEETASLAASKQARKELAHTDESNQALVRMERASFRLVLAGRRREAWALLTGREYERQKAIYSGGIKGFEREISVQEANHHRRDADYAYRRFLARVTLNGLVLALWFLALRRVGLAWRRQVEELRESEQRFMELTAELANEREHLATTLKSIGDGVIAVDMNGRVRMLNPVAEALTGWDSESAVGRPFQEVFNAVDGFSRARIDCPVQTVLRTGVPVDLADHTVLISRDGSERSIADSCAPIRDAGGALTGVVLVFRDETERKQAESQIRLHSAAINAAGDLIAIVNFDGQIVFANDAFGRQTGYGREKIIGRSLSVLWPQSQEKGAGRDVWAAIGAGAAWSGEMPCTAKDGSAYTADITITPLPDEEGRSEHLIVIARNITERKVYEGLLDYQAHHDALTDLPNRTLFSKVMASVISDKRRRREKCAVLFIDLDKFKLVNDTMGHQNGDALLVETAARLGLCLREGDIMARMGGDEFTVLLRHLRSAQDAGAVANRMLEQVAAPFEIAGSRLVIGASIGVSIYPDNATDVEGLLKAADSAMYKAKELGRNNCQFYSDELSQANQTRIDMERDLRVAVERDELRVYYQPVVDIRTMRVAGAEALLRWEHPQKGMISPGLFVPIAEETGLILEMGRMVLDAACKQCKSWQEIGYRDFQISVNVSPVQLRTEQFLSDTLDILAQTGMSAHCLNLEITETVLAKNDQGEMDALARLKAVGIETCLDDFGIGYSSLSRLKDFPIIHMKVDGSFIKDIANNPSDRAMIESIIAMAHKLGITVTTEWIETEAQLATIRSMGCDYAQGYLISPALPAQAFEDFMQKWTHEAREAEAA